MASVTIRGINDGAEHLPSVCVKTGVPTGNLLRLRGISTPAWTRSLIVFSWIAWLITSTATSRRYNVIVPCRQDVIRRWRILRVIGWSATGTATLLILAAIVEGSVPSPLEIALFVIGLVLHAFNGVQNGIGVSITSNGDIRLTRVHPNFRAAVLEGGVVGGGLRRAIALRR